MATRGNEPASVDVRRHAAIGALSLAVCAALVLATLVIGDDALVGAIASLLGGVTLLVATALLWYFPSFAKRSLRWRALAAPWPIALGVAALAAYSLADGMDSSAPPRLALAAVGAASLALGVLGLGVALLASAWMGAPWRSGVPFWRTEGEFRSGDRLAAALLLAGACALALAGSAGLLAVLSALGALRTSAADVGEIAIVAGAWGWAAALALLVLGALVHLLPRGRGQPVSRTAAVGGALLAAMGFALAPFGVATGSLAGAPRALLAVGIVLLLLGVHGHAPAQKRAGPRLREARWPLAASVVAAFAGAIGFFAHPTQRGMDLTLGILLATLLGAAALAILALPVVFNQRPAARYLPAAALLPLAAAIAARFSLAYTVAEEALRAAALVAFAAGIVALLAALWPLRRPRRYCPPDAEP